MTNPLDQFRSGLFGSRGVDVAASLEYVDQLASASSDPVAVQTAARVLLNTVIGAVDQMLNAPSPERLALIDLIDQRIDEHKLIREDDIEDKISQWMDDNVDIEDKISNWMSDNFDVTDYNVDDAISAWMSNNMTDEIESVIKNSLTFSVIVN
jgi:gas vesicle protein